MTVRNLFSPFSYIQAFNNKLHSSPNLLLTLHLIQIYDSSNSFSISIYIHFIAYRNNLNWGIKHWCTILKLLTYIGYRDQVSKINNLSSAHKSYDLCRHSDTPFTISPFLGFQFFLHYTKWWLLLSSKH